MAKKLRRILVVSWALPPYLSPRSLQVSRTLKELAKLGWQIDVITQNRSNLADWGNLDFELAREYKHEYRVYGARGNRLPHFGRALSRRPMPDPYGGWAENAKRLGESLIDSHKYSVLISFGQPWSSHLVGLSLKSASGLPWVAHFSDPWVDNPYITDLNAAQLRQMRSLEKEVVLGADRVIFTNKQTSQKVMKKYPPAWKKKAFVVPHGYEENRPEKEKGQIKSTEMRLVHSGNLYGLRSPETLIKAIGELRKQNQLYPKLRIQFVGKVKNKEGFSRLAKDLAVATHVEFLGRTSYRESDSLASQADVLLVIDAPSKRDSLFLPSKLIDYLKYLKPILGITPLKGASADLLKEFSYPIVDPLDVVGIAKQMQKLQKQFTHDKLRVSSNQRAMAKKYSIRITTQSFHDVIEQLAS